MITRIIFNCSVNFPDNEISYSLVLYLTRISLLQMMYIHVKWMIMNTQTEITWKEIVLSYVNILHISTHLITHKTKIFLQ